MNKRTRLIIIILSVFILSVSMPLSADPVKVSRIFITGINKVPKPFIDRITSISEGDEYQSIEEIDRKLLIIKERLLSTGAFNYIEIFYLGPDDELEIYIGLVENFIFPLESEGMGLSLFPHLPFYKTDLGFAVSDEVQAIVLGASLPYTVSLFCGAGHHFFPDNRNGLTGFAVFQYRLLPEMRFSIPFGINYVFKNEIEDDITDFSISPDILLNLSYLTHLYGIGFLVDAGIRFGVWENNYISQYDDVRLYARYLTYFETALRAQYYQIWGNYPYYRSAFVHMKDHSRTIHSDEASAENISLTKAVIFSFEQRFVNIPELNLGFSCLTFKPYFFADAARCIAETEDIIVASGYSVIPGCGIKLTFGNPFNITFSFEYGYDAAGSIGRFIFSIADFF